MNGPSGGVTPNKYSQLYNQQTGYAFGIHHTFMVYLGVSHPINIFISVSSKQDGTLLVLVTHFLFCHDQKLCNCSILFRRTSYLYRVQNYTCPLALQYQHATIKFATGQMKLPQHVVRGTTQLFTAMITRTITEKVS